MSGRDVDGIPEGRPKRCSTCREWLPSAEFHRNRRNRDGLQSRCKACHREAVVRHYRDGPGKAYRRAYQAREDVKARWRASFEAHREERLAARRAFNSSAWGRLLKAKDRALYKLRRATDPVAVERLTRLVAMHEAEIARMRAAREESFSA